MEKFSFLILILCLTVFAQFDGSHFRGKRTLVVPPTSPTRHQLISGIGIPLNLEHEAITLGLVLKAQYFLPDTVNQLKWIYFPGVFGNYTPVNYVATQWHDFPYGKRKRREVMTDEYSGQKYESYVEDVQEVSNVKLKDEIIPQSVYYDQKFDDEFPDDQMTPKIENFPKASNEELADNSGTRWLMYDGMGKFLESKGLQGRPCVLRGICEAAETKFTHESGLFSELLHIIFTPSTSFDTITNPNHYDYMKAEELGLSEKSCREIFHECKKSLLDIFTQIHDSKFFTF